MTIVIMVTVLAGVIPLMSPNNNSRKIREASRQLNSLLAQAQAQAARDGRPAGVAFRELVTGAPGSATYNGIAIEAFMIAEPAPFAGFSEWSRAQLHTASSTPGAAVDGIQFVTAPTLAADPLPPMTIRRNDVVEIGKHRFRITDPDRDGDGTPDDTAVPPFLPGDFYTRDGSGASHHVFICAPETSNAPVLNVDSSSLTTPRTYVIRRQPANTSDAPLQFPRGIGIDLQASGATGPDGPNTFDAPGAVDLIGIMFNPDGTLAGLHYVDKLERIQQIFLLLGLVENANNGSQDPNDYDFKNFGILDRDNLAQRRSRINWLNADSRWVTVNRAGRVLTSTNNLFDPSLPAFTDNLDTSSSAPPEHVQQRNRQIAAARDFAARMQQEGGR